MARRSLLRHGWLRSRHLVGAFARGLREGVSPARQPVKLDDVRRRLEIVLAATYGRAIPVAELPDDRPPRGVRRLVATVRAMRVPRLPTTDGITVLLPPSMPASMQHDEAVARYRLIAAEQAERVVRGTVARTPVDDALARDLFLIREAEAVDRAIARTNVGLLPVLTNARRSALESRPPLDDRSPQERAVEELVRGTLAGEIGRDEDRAVADESTADTSLRWAQETAARIRELPGRYRGVPPVSMWGTIDRKSAKAITVDPSKISTDPQGGSGYIPLGISSSSSDTPPETGGKMGVSDEESDAPPPKLPDDVQLPARSSQQGSNDVNMVDASGAGGMDELPPGLGYPEWDCGTNTYLPNGAIVRTSAVPEGDDTWAASILASRASLLRRVQQQFERLRARRVRLMQQTRGDDIDLVAFVRAIVDRRAGLPFDERVYSDVRAARRGLAITLLVDVSGSTDTQVTHTMQVIDIERIAVLLATTAFDSLGDPYNVLTFTGRGASDVRIGEVKTFAERSSAITRRRIASLRPEGGTRMGAAVRHAVALLTKQPAGHRLLLMLSDGRPNDIGYLDKYAVEDSRQAILEARAAGIFPFCLTIDRDGADYLSHVFGSTGHVVIRNPESLPSALLRAVRQLLRFA